MSEHENLHTLQRAYKAFAEGDIAAVVSPLTDDVEWRFAPSARIPWAIHPWRGRREVEQAFRMMVEALEFQIFQTDEFIVAPDRIVVLGHERCRVRATGLVVEADWAQVFAFRGGLVSRYREYSDTAAWETGYGG